jgi:hypothetical protein
MKPTAPTPFRMDVYFELEAFPSPVSSFSCMARNISVRSSKLKPRI